MNKENNEQVGEAEEQITEEKNSSREKIYNQNLEMLFTLCLT